MISIRAVPVILLAAGLARGHDFEPSRTQLAAIDRVLKLVRPGLDVATLPEVGRALHVFSADELRHIPDIPGLLDPGDDQRRLLHAVRAIRFARVHKKYLARPWTIALKLGARDARSWLEAVRLLRKRPFELGLERVAVSLATDRRPEVRLAAGRLLKTLAAFGRAGEHVDRIARRLVVDPDPNVAALFSARDAASFDTRAVFDLLVARMQDQREGKHVPGLLRVQGTVGHYVVNSLRNEFFWWRSSKPFSFRPSRARIRQWWQANRQAFRIGPDPGVAKLALDWKGVCKVGEKTKTNGDLRIEVRSYEEGWLDDKPVYSAVVVLWKKDAADWTEVGGGGPKNEDDGMAIRGQGWGDGPMRWREFHLAPLDKGGIRVRARLWQAASR